MPGRFQARQVNSVTEVELEIISVVDSVVVTLLEFLQVLQPQQLQLQDGEAVGEAVGEPTDDGFALGVAVGTTGWVVAVVG